MDKSAEKAEQFIAAWRDTGGSELANTQSFVNGLCDLIGVPAPDGSKPDDAENDYVFERRVFVDNGDGTTNFGRIDCYRRGRSSSKQSKGRTQTGALRKPAKRISICSASPRPGA